MNNIAEKIITFLGGSLLVLIFVVGILFITSFITMWAWNTLMPHAFNLTTINYWQALAFNMLAYQFRSTQVQKK